MKKFSHDALSPARIQTPYLLNVSQTHSFNYK